MPQLKTYLKELEKVSFQLTCPHCSNILIPKDFENHCFIQHGLDSEKCCVWCMGNETWIPGNRNVHHLIHCFQSFPFNHVPTPRLENDRVLEPIWPMTLDPLPLSFEDEFLNEASTCIRAFLDYSDVMEWYHITVHDSTLPNFVSNMDAQDGNILTLPFTCWCGDKKTLHRHMIIVVQSKRLQNFWKKMKGCRKKRIETPLELLNTIGYLNEGPAQCGFSHCESNDFSKSLVLAMQWEGGLMQVLNQKYKSTDPPDLVPHSKWVNGVCRIPIADLPDLASAFVLPVHSSFQHTFTPTSLYLHLNEGRKLYFFKLEEGETADPIPNLVSVAFGEDFWTPSPHQQKCIRMAKPLADRIIVLEKTVKEKGREADYFERGMDHFEEKSGALKRKLDTLEEEFKNLQRRHIQQLERENDILRMECRNTKRMRYSLQ